MKIRFLPAAPAIAALLLMASPWSMAQQDTAGPGPASHAAAQAQAHAAGNALAAVSAGHAQVGKGVTAPPLPPGSQSLTVVVGEAPDVAKRGRHAHHDPAYNKKDLTRDDTLVTPAIVPAVGNN